MGKGGRLVCIFLPGVCTVAALVCLVLVGLGGTRQDNKTLQSFYFFKVDMSNFTDTSLDLLPNTDLDNELLGEGLADLKSNLSLADYYTIYLWNYCSAKKTSDGGEQNVFCSPRKANFWFNPVEVWGLQNTTADGSLPSDLQKVLNVDQKVSHWMYIAYIVAFIATCVTFVLGFFAICSRWGSFVTTIASGVATLFTIAASATATGLYVSLDGAFNSTTKDFGIKTTIGHTMFAITWLAVAFSLVASVTWLFSVCCVSGKSTKRVKVEKTPYTYERVASPYLGASGNQAQNVPLTTVAGGHTSAAYEPFRHA